jgi:hypothetical protein
MREPIGAFFRPATLKENEASNRNSKPQAAKGSRQQAGGSRRQAAGGTQQAAGSRQQVNA